MARRPLLVATGAMALALFCIAPLVTMIATAAGGSGVVPQLDSRQQRLLAASVGLAAGTAIGATAIGVPLGVLLARGQVRARAPLRLSLFAPVAIPAYVTALALVYIGGWSSGPAGVVLVLSLAYYPVVMLATEASLARVAPRLEEAGLVVAAPRRVFGRITAPLAVPGIAAGALIVFVLALAEFGVPAVLRVPVYPTEVFTAFATLYDFGSATRLAMPLMGSAALGALVVAFTTGSTWLTWTRGVHVHGGLHVSASLRRMLLAWAALTMAVAAAAPVLVLAREAVRTRATFDLLWQSRQAVVNSLVVAAVAATVIAAGAFTIAYPRARGTSRAWLMLDALLLCLFAIPSTVLGVGLIALWNRDVTGVYNTPIMLVLAAAGRFLPLAAIVLTVAVRQIPQSHEEAAAVAGASWLQGFRHIVWPQLQLWAAGAWVIGFVFSFGELGSSVLIVPAGFDTLPVRIYTMVANAPPGHLAALALLQALVVVASLGALAAATRVGRR